MSKSDLRLSRVSPERFSVISGENVSNRCLVLVNHENGKPAEGVRIHYKILSGPVRFQGNQAKSQTVTTGKDGLADVSVNFIKKGRGVLFAQIQGDSSQAFAFQGLTEGMAERLTVYAPPVVAAEQGIIPVSVSAIDHLGNPVKDAEIHVMGSLGRHPFPETPLIFQKGLYRGVLKTKRAGCWRLIAEDRASGSTGTACVQMTAGEAAALKILEDPDPRVKPPFDESLLRVGLADAFGNALPPERIRCAADGKTHQFQSLFGNEARFLLDAAGYKVSRVNLTDSQTDIALRTEVLHAAAWLGGLGLILAGKKFTTPVYLVPAREQNVKEGQVFVTYNPQRAEYKTFRPNPDPPLPLSTTTTRDGEKITVSVVFEKPLTTTEFPEGIPIGYIDWLCLGEGETCFSVAAHMSPDTEPWEKCPTQKQPLRKNVCVNLIYNRDDPRLGNLHTQTNRIKARLERIYNAEDTIKTCCPYITFNVHATRYSRADWLQKVLTPSGIANTDGSGTVASNVDAVKFGWDWQLGGPSGTEEGRRENCINYYLVDIDPNLNTNGLSSTGPQDMDKANPQGHMFGRGVIDPDMVMGDTLAHEIGHPLGMGDDPPEPNQTRDPDELMFPNREDRRDTKIKRRQDCITVWGNIDTYSGS